MAQGVSILFVDDEAPVRRAITMLLAHDGHDVCGVDCAEAALEVLEKRNFDIIITDFSMPGMYGDQLVARIRQTRPKQPIIMATAFANEYEVFRKPEAAVDALLLKPFSLKELRAAIELVLTKDFGSAADASLTGSDKNLRQDADLRRKS